METQTFFRRLHRDYGMLAMGSVRIEWEVLFWLFFRGREDTVLSHWTPIKLECIVLNVIIIIRNKLVRSFFWFAFLEIAKVTERDRNVRLSQVDRNVRFFFCWMFLNCSRRSLEIRMWTRRHLRRSTDVDRTSTSCLQAKFVNKHI